MRILLTAVGSDVGKVRESNEDHVYLSEQYPNGSYIAIVADGMGGHLAGEIASKTAVETIYQELHPYVTKARSISELKGVLEEAIEKANTVVYQTSINDERYRGMGTTVVAAIVNEEGILLGHIGDSRAYLIDQEKIQQLTSDHSLVNELVKSGQISEEDAINHPRKNILTRALGTDESVKLDMNLIPWKKGQTLLLCSDGLTNEVSDEKIFELVNLNPENPNEIVKQLIDQANQAEGKDNISVILIHHG
ncbi:Stp1/IreP family PP2C-type Ser/Thr phosphatase [Tepidibacillus sp. LV47]|uniref:Stp1/IreP family PP2C-type Ser/Thr phosphatase n=1 Tax=Tepidibacillus sp. LV47 TaxID=3398228 RepID=UPI003AACC640